MNFSSIKEYFYKTYSYCFLIMLLPMCLLGLIHLRVLFANANPLLPDVKQEIVIAIFFSLAMVVLTIVHLYASKKLKKISREFGLGKKLDDYFILTLVRVVIGVILCFVIIAGYVVTHFESLNVLFFLSLSWIFFQIPTSRKACKELKLKGDERTMVYFKKDRF